MVEKIQLGRYGENPHQIAWEKIDESYEGPNVLTAPLHGKPLGYNNLLDANTALEVILDLRDRPAAVVMKHKNPCGLATGDDLGEAFTNAWFGDEVSAFGSIVGYSQEVDENVVKLLSNKFVEVLVAPSYKEDSLEWIKVRKSKKDLRVIATGPLEDAPEFIEKHEIRGGRLSQTQDNRLYLCDCVEKLLQKPQKITEPNSGLEYQVGVVTEKTFVKSMERLIEFAIIAGKHTKSNAIILAYEYEDGKCRVLGMGAGQPNRKDSGEKLALTKAQENLMRQYFREQELDFVTTMDKMARDSQYRNRLLESINRYTQNILASNKVVLFSDAFFPFRDGLVAAAELGVKYIIQPGGSKGDNSVIKAANEYGVSMVFTGIRHFRH